MKFVLCYVVYFQYILLIMLSEVFDIINLVANLV